MTSQYNIDKQRGSCADYYAYSSWSFLGRTGCFHHYTRYTGPFRCRPVLDYHRHDNASLSTYPIPLDEWLTTAQIASKGKGRKPTYVHFNLHRIENLVRIAHEVGEFNVEPTESTAHIIFEPRVREIVCADGSKRVIQTYYIRELQPFLESRFYHPDSYSCRRGRGSLRAVQQLQEYIYEQSEGYTRDVWLAKVDIRAFFMSIDCFKLYDIMVEFINKEMANHPQRDLLLYLTRITYLAATKDHLKDMSHPAERAMLDPRKSVYNQPYYEGVPIGDWTSQTGGLVMTTPALLYLESLGYWFVHYTDDTVVVVKDKRQWLEDVGRLERFYRDYLGLTLHPQKRYLQHYSKGVEMLGYKVRFNRRLPSDRIHHNIFWRLEVEIKKAETYPGYGQSHAEAIVSTFNSYLGLLRWCNAYRIRERICARVRGSVLGRYIKPADDCTKLAVREESKKANIYRTYFKTLKISLAA